MYCKFLLTADSPKRKWSHKFELGSLFIDVTPLPLVETSWSLLS
jgi:hypothetical protein